MNEQLLNAIAEGMDEYTVEKGHVIVNQGERGDAFYVIMEGVVSVTVSALLSLFCLFTLSNHQYMISIYVFALLYICNACILLLLLLPFD